jgi:hypothetical protein
VTARRKCGRRSRYIKTVLLHLAIAVGLAQAALVMRPDEERGLSDTPSRENETAFGPFEGEREAGDHSRAGVSRLPHSRGLGREEHESARSSSHSPPWCSDGVPNVTTNRAV